MGRASGALIAFSGLPRTSDTAPSGASIFMTEFGEHYYEIRPAVRVPPLQHPAQSPSA